MLAPWSASPIAESSRVRYSLFSATVEANAFTQSSTRAYETVTATASTTLLGAPPQARRIDRSVPQPCELIVELEQRDRAAGHLERCDVRPDQVARDLDPAALEQLAQLVVDDVELDRRGSTHAVHERQHLVALFVREVLDHRRGQALDDLAGGGELAPLATGLPVDADADLHLVVAELEGRGAGGGGDGRRERHAHAAAVGIDLPAQVGDLLQRLLSLRRRTADLLGEDGRAYAAASRRVEAVLDGDVVVDHDRLDLDAFAAGELGRHLEVYEAAGVVFDDVHHASTAVDCLRRLEHLVGRRRGEHLARAGGIEHAHADEAAGHRFVPGGAAGGERNLALHRSVGSIDVVGSEVHLQEVRIRGLHALRGLGDDVFGPVDELFHARAHPLSGSEDSAQPPQDLEVARAGREERLIRDRPERAADDRPHYGNQAVVPVRVPLARNREHGVDDARPEVPRRVDGVASRAAEREADHEHKQA